MDETLSAAAKREEIAKIAESDKLDEALYNLKENEIKFFKSQTGIQDEDELKAHVLSAQKEAYEVSMLEQMGGSKK